MPPVLIGFIFDGADRTDASVVDENIEFAEAIPDCLDRLLPTALAADVLLECDCPLGTVRVNRSRCLPDTFEINVSQDNVGALFS